MQITSLPNEPFLSTHKQVEYLTAKGVPVTLKTLNKLVTVGGGPKTVKFGNRRLSTPSWLDQWILSKFNTAAKK